MHRRPSRWLVVIGAVLLVAAGATACSGGARDEVVTYGGADAPVAAEAPAASDGSPAEGHHEHVGSGAVAPGEYSDAPLTPDSTTSTTRARESVSFAESARLGAGQLARVILRPTPPRRVVVEILEQAGGEARAETVHHLLATLRDVTAKQVLDGGRWSIADDRRRWSTEAINAAVDDSGHADHAHDQAVIHVLFLRGSFEAGSSVLGVATRADTVAVFVDQVAAASTALVGREDIEPAVAVHELGHLLGLVDLVHDTGRADTDHPGHSRNRGSVMYWAVESSLVTQVLSGGPPRHFDDDDLGDLAAIRNGA